MDDIFIHSEGQEKAAYHDGKEIARMTTMGYERFLMELYRWRREHGASPVWTVDEKGGVVPADHIERELARVSSEFRT